MSGQLTKQVSRLITALANVLLVDLHVVFTVSSSHEFILCKDVLVKGSIKPPMLS